MSVKVSLEKYGYKKDGFTGFSWTIFFFGFWVPICRKCLKDFVILFSFFIFKVIIFIIFFYQLKGIQNGLIHYGVLNISYSILSSIVLLVSSFLIEVWIAYYYNKHYTDNLLAKGYNVLENDEYSAAILKSYTYLPYSKEELADDNIMMRYETFSKLARKSERNKVITFFILLIVFYIILIAISILENHMN